MSIEEVQEKILSIRQRVLQIQGLYNQYGLIPEHRIESAISSFQSLAADIEAEYNRISVLAINRTFSEEVELHYWPAIQNARQTCIRAKIGPRTEQLQSALFDIQSVMDFFYPKTDER